MTTPATNPALPLAHHPLGRTGLRVAPVALGTVKLGRELGLKYPSPSRLPTDDEALELLRTARDLGVNLIDTAPAYGTSEERLGKLWPRLFKRTQLILCTKVGERFDPATQTSIYDFSNAHIHASIERSLARLGVAEIDIALLHFRSNDDLDERTLHLGQALGTLRQLQTKGLIRAVGASIGTPAGGALAAQLCDVVMLSLNATAADGVAGDVQTLAACVARGPGQVGVLIKKPLASGHGAVSPATGIARVLTQPGVNAAVVGTSNPAHLRQLAHAAGQIAR